MGGLQDVMQRAAYKRSVNCHLKRSINIGNVEEGYPHIMCKKE